MTTVTNSGDRIEIRSDVLERVRAEYLDMPGMTLTLEQVQRLCGIERRLCETVLESMVAARFLRLKPDGRYARSA